MPKRTQGAAQVAPRPRSGVHINPRRKITAPQAALDLWDRAADHADDDCFADWARGVLTVAAAEELGIDPVEALAVLSTGRGAGT